MSKNGLCHMTNMAAMSIMVKAFKNLLLWNQKKPMTLKLGMRQWLLEYYQICSNDDAGLNLTYVFYSKVKFGPFCFLYGKMRKL